MTTETDDLSYYETELPAVIAGVRRGEKWEWKSGDTWISGDEAIPRFQLQAGGTALLNFLRHHSAVRVRLAPVPVARWWNCRTDVPGPFCWMRHANGRMALIVEFDDDGVVLGGGGTLSWDDIAGKDGIEPWEHSTDFRNWSECVKILMP